MYIAISAGELDHLRRLMRGEVMAQAQRDYAAAGRVMGYGAARIIFRHLLPNAISPILVYWMTDMALASCWAPRSAISASARSRPPRNGASSSPTGRTS
ncbi:MAG: ABC transporter permease subunit [Acetobacteraceae bacterium]